MKSTGRLISSERYLVWRAADARCDISPNATQGPDTTQGPDGTDGTKHYPVATIIWMRLCISLGRVSISVPAG